MKPNSKVLIIAGSDSSGGAGIQADIKTITALGSYAMTAITAITAQNTTGVKSIVPIPPEEILNQILFTASIDKSRIVKSISKKLGVKISKIGKISRNNEKSVFINKKGEHLLVKNSGYRHQF